MELVLGVSMAPASIRMVLVEGENADGVTVEEENIDVTAVDDSPTLTAADQVIAAILGTREGAAEAGSRLLSTGVTWTDQIEAAVLRDALAARKIENVMLVSAFLAAAALAQTVGNAINYEHTAMLFVEPRTATLAVVDSADGSITDVHRRTLHGGDAVTELIGMLAGLHALPSCPDGVFVIGSGVDIAGIKPRLEAATMLTVSVPEEPEMALARGAALASANAPLFASSTAALAYAQDPGTGAVDPFAVAPGYLAVPDLACGAELSEEDLAYSAVADEDAAADTVVLDSVGDGDIEIRPHKPFLLTGSAVVATVVTAAALALVISLAINIRTTTVALRPVPGQTLIVPTAQPPAPAVAQPPVVSAPAPIHLPGLQPAPAHAVVAPAAPPLPAARVPVPAAPPIIAPVPAAPVPIPVRVPAPAPPVRAPTPQLPMRLPALQPQLQPPQPVQSPVPQPLQRPRPPSRVPTPAEQEPVPDSPWRVPGGESPDDRVPGYPQRMPGGESPGDRFPGYPQRVPGGESPRNLFGPQPPIHLPGQEPPVNLPAPEPPVRLPEPEAPRMPAMPAPQAPMFPAPGVPRMPFPGAPVMPHLPRLRF